MRSGDRQRPRLLHAAARSFGAAGAAGEAAGGSLLATFLFLGAAGFRAAAGLGAGVSQTTRPISRFAALGPWYTAGPERGLRGCLRVHSPAHDSQNCSCQRSHYRTTVHDDLLPRETSLPRMIGMRTTDVATSKSLDRSTDRRGHTLRHRDRQGQAIGRNETALVL
jgi:hypothetical protein